MYRIARAFLVLLTSVLVFAAPASAQQGTPAALDIPSSGECWVRPVSVLSILSMLNKVEEAQYYWPISSIPLSNIERGESISLEDFAGIDETNRQLVACANAVSPLQMMAMLDEYFQARLVREVMYDDGVDALVEHLPMLASQTADTEGIVAFTVVDAWYQEGTNKRVLAVIEPYIEDESRQAQFLVSYVYSIDRWLIADVSLIRQ